MSSLSVSAPQPLADKHVIDDFDCGQDTLNYWLKKKALKSEGLSSRTYVVCVEGQVVGYYCLAMGNVVRSEAPGKLRRNMPDPLPVMVLGRLAVDVRYKKLGIGRGLLKDAVLRADKINQNVGFRALMVHALDEEARAFYETYGFLRSPHDEWTLFLPLPAIQNHEVSISVYTDTIDNLIKGCSEQGSSCRLALAFFDAGECGLISAQGESLPGVVRLVGTGQIVVAPGVTLEDIQSMPEGAWDCVAVMPVFSQDGGLMTRSRVESVIASILHKLKTGNPEGISFFRRDGVAYLIDQSKLIDSPEFETDIN